MEPSGAVKREGQGVGDMAQSTTVTKKKKVPRLLGKDSKIPREQKIKKKIREYSERWKQMNIVFDVLRLAVDCPCCSFVYKNQ
jgi:hypothetical protein